MGTTTFGMICRRIACQVAIGVVIAFSTTFASVPEARASCNYPSAQCAFGVLMTNPSTGNDCLVGTCPPNIPLSFGGAQSGAFYTARSFPNGDSFEIVGNLSLGENASGTSLPGTYYLRIKLLSGPGGPSAGDPDTFVLHVQRRWTLNANASNLLLEAVGSFSSGVAATSNVTVSAQYSTTCGQVSSQVLGPINDPPLTFNQSTSTFVGACNGSFLLVDYTITINFRAGTLPESYIEVGDTAAPPLAATHDMNGDRASDIFWMDSSGNTSVWFMNGTQVLQASGVGAVPGWSVIGKRDFNGDGTSDLLWRDGSGNMAMWLMDSLRVLQSAALGAVPLAWGVYGTRDVNGDGKGDILWKDTSGNVAIWLMNGLQVQQVGSLGNVGASWSIVGNADFNGDGKGDVLWRDTGGNLAIWLMNGLQVSQTGPLGNPGGSWAVVATGDFNGDGKGDILWKDASGNVAIWLMNGLQVVQAAGLGSVGPTWSVQETGDYNADGFSDILWRDNNGNTAIWFMNGAQVLQVGTFGNVPTTWTVQGANSE